MVVKPFAWPVNELSRNSHSNAPAERTVQERRWFILGAMDALDGRAGPGEGWPVGGKGVEAREAYRLGYEAGKRYKGLKAGRT